MYIRKDQGVALGIHQPSNCRSPKPAGRGDADSPEDQTLPLGHPANPILSHFVGVPGITSSTASL